MRGSWGALGWVSAALLIAPALAAKEATETVAVELALGTRQGLHRCRFEIQRRAVDRDEAFFERLFAYADVNADGRLGPDEVGLLPSAFSLRQALWGRSIWSGCSPAERVVLDGDGDGRITEQELIEGYLQLGAQGLVVAGCTVRAGDKLDAILRRGLPPVIERAAWDRRIAELKRLDEDGNGAVRPLELGVRDRYPGVQPTQRLGPRELALAASGEAVVALISAGEACPRWSDELVSALDKNLDAVLSADEAALAADHFARLDGDQDGRLSASELKAWRNTEPDWLVTDWSSGSGPRSSGIARALVSGWDCRARADAGAASAAWRRERQATLAEYAAVQKASGEVTVATALKQPRLTRVRALTPLADRNRNQAVDADELTAWLALQEANFRRQLLVGIWRHGPGLYELLDADGDGRLALGELDEGWSRLEEVGCVIDGQLAWERLPRQLRVVVSHGQAQSPLAPTRKLGPDWFWAMDQNHDAELVAAEFLGEATVFAALDANGDGRLSVAEASSAAAD